ncbi:LysE family translocator [Gammaproteobacteria bacterium]|nr:LysE family translocator [Gammaproteobacteria bacterium]
MTVSLWLLFVVTFVSALAIPGPNAGYAIAQTLTNGPRSGLLASAGFAVASGLNLFIVMAGLGLLLASNMHVLIYLKWIGVGYLLFMAYKVFTAVPDSPNTRPDASNTRIFVFAILISLSNPKVVLINMMLLPVFLSPDKPILTQGAVIVATGTLLSFLVYSAYALFASKFMSKLKSNTTNKIVGVIYTSAAGAIAAIGK